MPELLLTHIDQITRDITSQEITLTHLRDDLVDHVCCDVESEMLAGLNFVEAYDKVKRKMGSPRRIKEIQEETLYVVDLKYRKMKMMMKFTGIAGTIMLGFAAVLKILHLQGAGILLSSGALILALGFMPSALVVLWKETHSTNRLTLFISAFIAGTLFIIGMLFKLQHWPGAGVVISASVLTGVLFFIPSLLIGKLKNMDSADKRGVYFTGTIGVILYAIGFLFRILHFPYSGLLSITGIIILFFVVFPWYTWITWREESHVRSKFIFMVVGSLSLIVPSVLVNLNIEGSYEEGIIISQKQQEAMFNYLQNNNQLFLDNYRDLPCYSTMEQLHAQTGELLSLISGIEGNLVAGSLLPQHKARTELEEALSGFCQYLSEFSIDPEFQKVTDLLDPASHFPGMKPYRGEINLSSEMHSLLLLKNSVLLAENYTFRTIASDRF